jgi:glyoxylase-like metal-dependent hydrolase (beta-lactamase superfamily II)
MAARIWSRPKVQACSTSPPSRNAPAPFTLEPGQALASLGRISEIDATWVLPGHGPAWDRGVAEAVRLTREAAAR